MKRFWKARAMNNLDFFSEGYSIESSMIAYFSKMGLHICEFPISVNYDVPNKHKKNPIMLCLGVLGNIVSMIGHRRTMLNFGIPGFAAIIIAALLGWNAFHVYYVTEKFPSELSILTAFLMILWMLLFAIELILNKSVPIQKAQISGQRWNVIS